MSNQSKRMRASSCMQKEGFEIDQHSQTNQGLRNTLLHQEATSKRRKYQGLHQLPISSWIESQKNNGSIVSSSFAALKSSEATNIMTSRRSTVPNVSNSTSHSIDDTLVFPNSFVVSLRAQTRGVDMAGDIPADARVARIERKREINRQSAQRKRQREKDQIDFLSEKHHQLRLQNEELKRERKKIMEMIESVKSGKIVSSSEPMSISSSTTPVVPNPKLSAPDTEKTNGDLSSRLDMLNGLANSCGQNPMIGTTTTTTNWRIQDRLPPAQSSTAVSSLYNILPATAPGSANTPVSEVSVNSGTANSSGSIQPVVTLLLAALLEGKPEMVQLLKEFVDNEVARQRQIEEQR